LINDLRWNLHGLWPELKIPARRLNEASVQVKVARRRAAVEKTAGRVLPRCQKIAKTPTAGA
jgi:hypothetical protein